jgi:hypothetical protein
MPFLGTQRSVQPNVRAGEACNSTQDRLARPENYPTAYMQKRHPPSSAYKNQGDYCTVPRMASKLLLNTSSSDLTIPGRATDFRTEVRIQPANLRSKVDSLTTHLSAG